MAGHDPSVRLDRILDRLDGAAADPHATPQKIFWAANNALLSWLRLADRRDAKTAAAAYIRFARKIVTSRTAAQLNHERPRAHEHQH